jgi:hypothetical protein
MLLTLKNRPFPCRIFDSEGTELNRVVEANLETGEVEQYVYSEGKPVIENGAVKRIRSFHPAPLRIERKAT